MSIPPGLKADMIHRRCRQSSVSYKVGSVRFFAISSCLTAFSSFCDFKSSKQKHQSATANYKHPTDILRSTMSTAPTQPDWQPTPPTAYITRSNGAEPIMAALRQRRDSDASLRPQSRSSTTSSLESSIPPPQPARSPSMFGSVLAYYSSFLTTVSDMR